MTRQGLPDAMRFETVFLRGDGLRLAADAIGDPAAPPVLFFHGGGQSRRAWRTSAERVAQAGYRTLTFDLRGHGDSDWAPDGDYLLQAYGRDVEVLLGQFDRPVALVGASRGGQAALVGGAGHPDRVSLIMLADVAPVIAQPAVNRISDFFRASTAGFASLDEAAQVLADHMGHGPRRDSAGLRKAMRTDAAGRLFWHWDPRTVAPEFLNPASEGEALQDAARLVRSPVILVRGEHSDLVTPESVRSFARLTPQLIVLEAKGEGHMFTGDANDRFAETLVAQLRRFAPNG